MTKKIILKDLDIRYKSILKQYPDIEKCSTKGCKNPVDITPGMGKDTSCAYHRLLFDFWMYEIIGEAPPEDKRTRRSMFAKWTNKVGKKECNRIVLFMANDPINWSC